MSETKALPSTTDWRQQAKERETAKPAMGVTRLAVDAGRLLEGEDTVLKDGITLVPLAAIYARAFYTKPYDAKTAQKGLSFPDCYSTSASKDFVGVSPESNSPSIQSESCEACPLGSWEKSGWEPGQKAPKCGTRRNVLAKDPTTGKVYRLSVPPTGVRDFDLYWSSLSGPLAGSLVKITANGRIPAFEKKEDLTYDQFMSWAQPYIEQAEKLLRQPINFDAAKKDEESEAPIVPGKPAPEAPKGKARF